MFRSRKRLFSDLNCVIATTPQPSWGKINETQWQFKRVREVNKSCTKNLPLLNHKLNSVWHLTCKSQFPANQSTPVSHHYSVTDLQRLTVVSQKAIILNSIMFRSDFSQCDAKDTWDNVNPILWYQDIQWKYCIYTKITWILISTLKDIVGIFYSV